MSSNRSGSKGKSGSRQERRARSAQRLAAREEAAAVKMEKEQPAPSTRLERSAADFAEGSQTLMQRLRPYRPAFLIMPLTLPPALAVMLVMARQQYADGADPVPYILLAMVVWLAVVGFMSVQTARRARLRGHGWGKSLGRALSVLGLGVICWLTAAALTATMVQTAGQGL